MSGALEDRTLGASSHSQTYPRRTHDAIFAEPRRVGAQGVVILDVELMRCIAEDVRRTPVTFEAQRRQKEFAGVGVWSENIES